MVTIFNRVNCDLEVGTTGGNLQFTPARAIRRAALNVYYPYLLKEQTVLLKKQTRQQKIYHYDLRNSLQTSSLAFADDLQFNFIPN